MRPHPFARWALLIAVLLVVLSAVAVGLSLETGSRLVVMIAGCIVLILVLAAAIVSNRRRSSAPGLDSILEKLAVLIRDEWAGVAEREGLMADPLRVSWAPATLMR